MDFIIENRRNVEIDDLDVDYHGAEIISCAEALASSTLTGDGRVGILIALCRSPARHRENHVMPIARVDYK